MGEIKILSTWTGFWEPTNTTIQKEKKPLFLDVDSKFSVFLGYKK